MVTAWLGYLLTLACGGAFYLFYPAGLSFYTLMLLLVLPFLSLGLTLLSLRRLKLDVTCDQAVLVKGDAAFLRLALQGPRSASGARARLVCRVENKLYPQLSETVKLTVSQGAPQTFPLPSRHCGWLSFTVEKCALTDWLGLFPLRLKTPPPVLALVWPQSGVTAAGADCSPTQGRPLRPKPGGGPGEDYELRPYRPGDSVTAIHWKLTAKQPDGDPILRETMEPVPEALAVTYDHFGGPDDVDALLGELEGLERRLLEAERPFTLCWAHPESGRITRYDIDCPDAWQRCYRALAQEPAPLQGQGVPEGRLLTLPGHSGPVRRIHLTLPKKEVSP